MVLALGRPQSNGYVWNLGAPPDPRPQFFVLQPLRSPRFRKAGSRMTQMSEEEFHRRMWQQPDPRPDQEKAENYRARKWLLAIGLGVFVGFGLVCLTGVPVSFFAGWAFGTVGIGSWLEGEK